MTEMKKRENVIVDVYPTEDDGEVYRVNLWDNERELGIDMEPRCCSASGFFLSSDALDDWLVDHAGEIHVVKDYR